jgi:hypothetical protein
VKNLIGAGQRSRDRQDRERARAARRFVRLLERALDEMKAPEQALAEILRMPAVKI